MKVQDYCTGAALLAVSAISQAAAPSFTSVEIPLPAAATQFVNAVGINSQGDIAGVFGPECCSGSPFVYFHATGTDVVFNGFDAGGINDSDQVAGTIIDQTPQPQAVLFAKNGSVLTLPAANLSAAAAVSNDGDVVGSVANGGGSQAVLWNTQPTVNLINLGVIWPNPVLPEADSAAAQGVNNSSHVTGQSTAGQGTTPDTAQPFGTHAFLYRNGSMLDLGALALTGNGNDFSEGNGINNLDAVVGDSDTAIAATDDQGQPCEFCGVANHAFLWRAGTLQDLGTLGGVAGLDSRADAINDSGDIVGWSDSLVNGTSTQLAFLYTGGQMLNLQSLVTGLDPHVQLTEAVGINCQGWIVANGFNTQTPTVNRIYLLIRNGAPPAQCTPQVPKRT